VAWGWTRPGKANVWELSILDKIRLGCAKQTVAETPIMVETKME
jgi:hypothetical protein